MFGSFVFNSFELTYKKKKVFIPKTIFDADNLPFVIWLIKNVLKMLNYRVYTVTI